MRYNRVDYIDFVSSRPESPDPNAAMILLVEISPLFRELPSGDEVLLRRPFRGVGLLPDDVDL